jgi:hypothetical protein
MDLTLYFLWRLAQGKFRQGIRTRLRRLRRTYEADNPSDIIEYHVVRQGVDQRALVEAMRPLFSQITVLEYWSAQSRIAQRLGVTLHRTNTFALICRGYRPSTAEARP